MHVSREVVNTSRTGGGACYADGPRQAVNHHSAQPLARRLLDLLMIHLRQQLLDREEEEEEYCEKRKITYHRHIPVGQLCDREGDKEREGVFF